MKAVWIAWLWIKEVGSGLVRNARGNLNVFVLSAICLLLFSSFYSFGENVQYLAGNMGNKIEIQTYVKESIAAENHADIEAKIRNLKEVKDVKYISKEEAVKHARELMSGVEEAINSLETNPFPASFVITLKDSNQVKQVSEKIKGWQEFDEVKYGQYVENLLQVSNFFKKIGWGVSALVALYAIVIISNTIKRNIAQRSNEIEIKRLIGAGMFTIRVPFILETLFVTSMASLAVYMTLWFGYPVLIEFLAVKVPFLSFLPAEVLLERIDQWILWIGLGVGCVGSMASVKKYVQRY
ncbi:permease-like cell division protein FtsX [Bacillus luti]|nr:cell division protein [Bacillus cereus]